MAKRIRALVKGVAKTQCNVGPTNFDSPFYTKKLFKMSPQQRTRLFLSSAEVTKALGGKKVTAARRRKLAKKLKEAKAAA